MADEPNLKDLMDQRELLFARLDRLTDEGGSEAEKEALAKEINAIGDQIEKIEAGN